MRAFLRGSKGPKSDQSDIIPPLIRDQHHNNRLTMQLITAVLLLSFGVVCAALGFGLGSKRTQKPTGDKSSTITFPDNTAVIAECVTGRGKQIARTQDLPAGPIYNLHPTSNQLIGIEYTFTKTQLVDKPQDFLVKLPKGEFDHAKVGLFSTGHPGEPSPHYHLDLFLISPELASSINC